LPAPDAHSDRLLARPLIVACLVRCESEPEKSEATGNDKANPAEPHRYRPVPDVDCPAHKNPHQVEQRHRSKDYPGHVAKRFRVQDGSYQLLCRERPGGAIALRGITKTEPLAAGRAN